MKLCSFLLKIITKELRRAKSGHVLTRGCVGMSVSSPSSHPAWCTGVASVKSLKFFRSEPCLFVCCQDEKIPGHAVPFRQGLRAKDVSQSELPPLFAGGPRANDWTLNWILQISKICIPDSPAWCPSTSGGAGGGSASTGSSSGESTSSSSSSSTRHPARCGKPKSF